MAAPLAVGESLSFMNGLGQIYSSMGQVHCLRGQYKEAMAKLLEKAVNAWNGTATAGAWNGPRAGSLSPA